MLCLHCLSTHKSDNPENPTSIGRHRKVHLDIFSFIRHLLFIKWETCKIDVQELFKVSIHNIREVKQSPSQEHISSQIISLFSSESQKLIHYSTVTIFITM